jgi:hypothetical protein
MKQTFQYLIIIAMLPFLTGCHFIPGAELYNNTGSDIVITTITSFNGEMRNTLVAKNGQSVFLGCPLKLEILFSDKSLHYDVQQIPYKLYKDVGGNRRVALLQMQYDGSIVLLLPNAITPTVDIPPQPTGYPLMPR